MTPLTIVTTSLSSQVIEYSETNPGNQAAIPYSNYNNLQGWNLKYLEKVMVVSSSQVIKKQDPSSNNLQVNNLISVEVCLSPTESSNEILCLHF